MDIDALNARLLDNNYNSWLGVRIVKAGPDGVEVTVKWREEFVANRQKRFIHGGVLAAIIDLTADFAIAAQTGIPAPTIDLRIDYHKAAMPGDLLAKGRVINLGRNISSAEANIFDSNGVLVTSGRGVYVTRYTEQ